MLESVRQKVHNPVTEGVLMPKPPSLVINLEWLTVLNAVLKSINSFRAYVLLQSRCGSTECNAVETASSVLLLLR